MDFLSRPFAALAAAALAGCSSTWQSGEPVQPASYSAGADAVPRYTGKLRRMVLLPAVVQPVGESCARYVSPEAGAWLEQDARAFLADWKGYEVVAPQAAGAGERALARELGAWQQAGPKDAAPPAPLAARLNALAVAQRADALLVLYSAPECYGTTDAVLAALLIGAPSLIAKATGRDFSAGIYDASGTLVWRRHVGLGPINTEWGLRRADAAQAIEHQFGLLENAIPEILLR
jgi:hypothetical protein